MCGIVGTLVLRGGADPALGRTIATARDRLAHRGPDDAGLWVDADGCCALAAQRLAIRDRSPAGRQPMPNEDETIWVVFNGEIYNADALRYELLAAGHRFRSRGDTEILVHLYEDHGAEFVHRLDGIFSFVVYDRPRRRLVGARDRLGVKPLYYACSARRFAFASEPKALLALPEVGRTPRLEELPAYLAFNCVPGPATLHRDIAKLEPGSRFEVSAAGGFRRERFWTPPPPARRYGGARERMDALDGALRAAVAKRMVADVPVGATLSGGIDSGLVVALMAECSGAPVPTFTIGYPGQEQDPTSDPCHARTVAAHFGTLHHEIVLTADALGGLLDDLATLADDPIGAPSEAALLCLARAARERGVTVLQIGEGADEGFDGYLGAHRLARIEARLARFGRLLPPRLAGLLGRAGGAALERVSVHRSRIGSADGSLRELLRRHAHREALYWGHGVLFTPPEQERLRDGGSAVASPYDRLAARLALVDGFARRPYVERLALTDLVLQLPERLLMRVDRATMRYGVEARVPFLDPAVLALAFGVPRSLRLTRPKPLLRAYAAARLPITVATRPKVGFPTPGRVFLGAPVLADVRAKVLAKPFLELTAFAPDRVRDLLRECEHAGMRGMPQLWSLYVLALWVHHWT